MPFVQLLLDYVHRAALFPAQYRIKDAYNVKHNQIVLVFSYTQTIHDDMRGTYTADMESELVIVPHRTVEEVWDWITVCDRDELNRRKSFVVHATPDPDPRILELKPTKIGILTNNSSIGTTL